MGIFDEQPDIGKLVKNPHFIEFINYVESRVWISSESVIQKFLWKRNVNNYIQLVNELIQNYRELSAKMSK